MKDRLMSMFNQVAQAAPRTWEWIVHTQSNMAVQNDTCANDPMKTKNIPLLFYIQYGENDVPWFWEDFELQ